MRSAICKLIEMCPPSLAALRANVVMLYGNVEDEFAPSIKRGRCSLEEVLISHYEPDATTVLSYSLQRGLHRMKTDCEDASAPAPSASTLNPMNVIGQVMASAKQRFKKRAADSVGAFANSPAEALREINRVLAGTRKAFVFFAYSPNISFIGDTSADIAPLLESLPHICRRNDHLFVFAGCQRHPDLDRALDKSKQKLLMIKVGGPSASELETIIVTEEMRQHRSLVDCSALAQVIESLEYVGGQHTSGLKTIIDNYLRVPNCWLDSGWAKENNAAQFDPERINTDALEAALDQAIVGQAIAKQSVLDQLTRFREFGRQSRGPFLRLLFVGPSGVGKTELARIVCQHVFGSNQPMLLVACTEYAQPHEVAKLLGAPPGYTGHEQPALLESHRKRFPAGLLLLDEFEKAHADIHRFFMNILEEGFATSPRTEDGQPVRLDFTNYIVIATSNAGSREIDVARVGATLGQRRQRYEAALKSVFPVELLGRFQERIVFDFLSLDELEVIARRHAKGQIAAFRKSCEERKLPMPVVEVDEGIFRQLAALSDSSLGARDLRGKVERHFQQAWIKQYGRVSPKPAKVRISTSEPGVPHD